MILRYVSRILILVLFYLNVFFYGHHVGYYRGYVSAMGDVVLGNVTPYEFFLKEMKRE